MKLGLISRAQFTTLSVCVERLERHGLFEKNVEKGLT